jgi:hypothetical protein
MDTANKAQTDMQAQINGEIQAVKGSSEAAQQAIQQLTSNMVALTQNVQAVTGSQHTIIAEQKGADQQLAELQTAMTDLTVAVKATQGAANKGSVTKRNPMDDKGVDGINTQVPQRRGWSPSNQRAVTTPARRGNTAWQQYGRCPPSA